MRPKLKLKPCPFCGGKAALINGCEWLSAYSAAECTRCGLRSPLFFVSTSESSDASAAEYWNKRVYKAKGL